MGPSLTAELGEPSSTARATAGAKVRPPRPPPCATFRLSDVSLTSVFVQHVWPRTTFNKGGHETIRQRGRHRQRIFYATHDVSVHLTQPRARLWARSASGQQHSFCQHVPSMPPLPCHACHAAPHLAAPCCAGAARPLLRFVQDAAISRCSPGPPGRLRLRCMCVCVCWVW